MTRVCDFCEKPTFIFVSYKGSFICEDCFIFVKKHEDLYASFLKKAEALMDTAVKEVLTKRKGKN